MKLINLMYFFSNLEEFIEKRENIENYSDPYESLSILLLANLSKLVINREKGENIKLPIIETARFAYESLIVLIIGKEIERGEEDYPYHMKEYFDRFRKEDVEKIIGYTELDDLRKWMREAFTGTLFLPGGLKRKP